MPTSTSSLAQQEVTDSCSLYITPRIKLLAEWAGFDNLIEAALFDKTGLVPLIKEASILLYDDFQNPKLVSTLNISDYKFLEQAVSIYKTEAYDGKSVREFRIALPRQLVLHPILNGSVERSRLFYKKYSEYTRVSHTATSLFSLTLTTPIVTPDCLVYKTCMHYYQAMRTVDYETRENITEKDSVKDAQTFWQLPSWVIDEYHRKDWGIDLAFTVLVKAFDCAYEKDGAFRSLLLSTGVSPLVYYSLNDDFSDLTIDSLDYTGKNLVGKALMYTRYKQMKKAFAQKT